MKKNKYILSIVLFMTVLVIDQIIKVCVKTGMFLGERIEITSWFSLVFVENNGMAFGWELWGGKLFLTLFRVVAVCLWLYRLPHPHRSRCGRQYHRLPVLWTHLQQPALPSGGRISAVGIWLW